MESEQRPTQEQTRDLLLEYLYQGKAFLDRGDLAQALSVLEQARVLAPTNTAVRTLLALTCFRVGHLDSAEALYQELLSESPNDATLQVNLAMLYMQKEMYDKARHYLETALAVQSDYIKARGMLGLVYAKLGWYQEAKDQFEAASRPEMVAKMEQKLAAQQASTRSDSLELAQVSEAISDFVLENTIDQTDQAIASQELRSSNNEAQSFSAEDHPFHGVEHPRNDIASTQTQETASAFTGSEQAQSEDALASVGSPSEPMHVVVLPPESKKNGQAYTKEQPEDVPFSMFSQPELQLGQSTPPSQAKFHMLDTERIDLLRLQQDKGEHSFLFLENGDVLVQSQEQIFTRLAPVISMTGAPEVEWEYKRFQGKPLEQLFGPRENPLARIKGKSQLLLQASPGLKRFCLMLDEEQGAYFREGCVLAFEGQLLWENGRVPSPSDEVRDLPLDNLWGDGLVLLEAPDDVWGFPIRAGHRVRISYPNLIGWLGNLVPRIVVMESTRLPTRPPLAFIEFEGEGHLLLSR